MPDDYKKDLSIEDEIAKSLQRVVEEEVNVAKAYVDNQSAADSSAKDTIDSGKTRTIPVISEELLHKNSKIDDSDEEDDYKSDNPDDILLDDEEDDDEEFGYGPSRSAHDRSFQAKHRPSAKKSAGNAPDRRLVIGGIVASVAVVAVIITIVIVSSANSKKGYTYYYDEGMKYYEVGNYGSAAEYLSKASDEADGKKNLELKFTLYKCYNNIGKTSEAKSVLKDILSYDENYEDAVSALADIYYNDGDVDELNELIKKYEDSKSSDAVSKYIVSAPKGSEESGSYDDDFELKLSCDTGDVIYYTTDGSEPSEKSTLYDGTAIQLETGTTEINAIAVDSFGIMSKVTTLTYVIEFGTPDAPDVTPASGQYSSGEKIVVNNIPEDCKVYYTTDGKTPTEASTEYTGEIDMPEGNNVFTFITINEHSQCSTVTKRNYNVAYSNTSYTYSQAESLLRSTLVARGVINASDLTTDGSSVTFVYQTKTTVDDVEMYVVRCDYTKNGTTTVNGYYGIGVTSGIIYKVTGTEGNYKSAIY